MSSSATTRKLTSSGTKPFPNQKRKEPKQNAKTIRVNSKVKKLKETDLMCKDVCAWSKLVSNPFGAKTEGVFMPLAEDNFPCASITTDNYASEVITIGSGDPEIQINVFGSSGHINSEHGAQYLNTSFNAGTATGIPGCILDYKYSSDAQTPGVAAAWFSAAANSPFPIQRLSSTVGYTPVYYDPLTTPFLLVANTDGTSNRDRPDKEWRTIAQGIRVSFVSRLSNTDGWVEFAQPYEPAVSHGETVDFKSLRRTPTYQRKVFGQNQAALFTWRPNCESVKYHGMATTRPTPTMLSSRQLLRLGGLNQDDRILIEIITFQSFTGPKLGGIAVPNPVSSDSTHVMNAIADDQGAHTRDGKPIPIAQHAIHNKVAAHPFIGPLLAGAGESLAGGLKASSKHLLDKVGEVLRAAPTALMANPELLTGFLLS